MTQHGMHVKAQPVGTDEDPASGNSAGYFWPRFLLAYVPCFVVAAGFILAFFFVAGKSLVMQTDGFDQHVKAFAYYGAWLRAAASSLLSGADSFPAFSFALGMGSDVQATLHYYVLGDPLNLLAALVPQAFAPALYQMLVFVRLFLAGLAFAAFCCFMKQRRSLAVAAGALVYVFCGFSVTASVMHPYFINPLIYFPLLLLGVERLLRDGKAGLFGAIVAFAAASSFYFFYMLAFVVALYIFWRVCALYGLRLPGEALKKLGMLLAAGILGAFVAAIVISPAVLAFLSSPRAGGTFVPAWYSAVYYQTFVTGLFSIEPELRSWAPLGLSPFVLVAVVALCVQKDRRSRFLKLALAVFTLFMLLPAAGSALNGFSYPSHRWTWAFAFLAAYVVVAQWPQIMRASTRQLLACSAVFAVYVACVGAIYLKAPGTEASSIVLGLFGFVVPLVLAAFRKHPSGMQLASLCLVLASVLGNVYFVYSSHHGDYTAQFKTPEQVALLWNSDASWAAEAAAGAGDGGGSFVRIDGNNPVKNASLLAGVSSTQFYWSLPSEHYERYLRSTMANVSMSQQVAGLEGRTMALEAASVSYYLASGKAPVPYAYEKVGEKQAGTDGLAQSLGLYRNTRALPLGYAYTQAFTQAELDALPALDRQAAMLDGVALEHMPAGIAHRAPQSATEQVGYHLSVEGGTVEAEMHSVTVHAGEAGDTAGAALGIVLEDAPGACESYLCFEGFDIEGMAAQAVRIPVDFIAQDGTLLSSTSFVYRTADNRWYAGYHDIAVNSGYSEQALAKIVVHLPVAARYRFENLEVRCLPLEGYEASVAQRFETVLEDVDMHYCGNTAASSLVTGHVSPSEKCVLVFSVPYSTGWKLFVDGAERELVRANIMYLGAVLEPGEHSIRLEYRTPGLLLGACLCACGLAGALLWFFLARRQGRRSPSLARRSPSLARRSPSLARTP